MDADVLSWDDIAAACTGLADEIRSKTVPDVVVGISRGGLVPAVLVTHLLGVRDLRALTISRTVTDQVNAAKHAAPIPGNPAALGDLEGLDVLVADDVAGSGQTIATAAGLVASMKAARVRTAVLVVNDASWAGGPLPGHVAIHAGRWVIFPWEVS